MSEIDLAAIKATAEEDMKISREATFTFDGLEMAVHLYDTANIEFVKHARTALPASAQAVLKLAAEVEARDKRIRELEQRIAAYLDLNKNWNLDDYDGKPRKGEM